MMKYPRLCDWISIKDDKSGCALIFNELTDETFETEASTSYVQFIKQLDGKTDPYTISCEYSPRERETILNELAENKLIRYNLWLNKSLFDLEHTIYIPKRNQNNNIALKLINVIIRVFFFPIFSWGLYSFASSNNILRLFSISIPGILFGVFWGVLFHELGHMVSCWANGGKVYECGIQINYLVIPSFYVLMKSNDSAPTYKKIHNIASGSETNFLISGVAFLIAAQNIGSAGFWFFAAMINAGLALVNLILRDGNDGCKILSLLFGLNGEKDVVQVAKSTLLYKLNRVKLLRHHAVGYATFCSYLLVLIFQLSTPIMLIIGFLEVLLWII